MLLEWGAERLATEEEYNKSSRMYEIMADIALVRRLPDTIVIAGWGACLKVEGDRLAVIPGKTHRDMTAKVRYLYRGTHEIKHIVILSNKGSVTFDALKWLCEQDISVMVIGNDDDVLLALPSKSDPYSALRRAQYLAVELEYNIEIAKIIIRMKTEEQVKMLRKLPPQFMRDKQIGMHERKKAKIRGYMPESENICTIFEAGIQEVNGCITTRDILLVEARLAKRYWDWFTGLPITWNEKDQGKISPHWFYCSERVSSLSSNDNASQAINPWQAVTNYAYAICQAQCKQSLLYHGFDVSCGFLHTDRGYRDSMVFDLLELHRSQVDYLVYNMFSRLTLSRGDFMTTKLGECRMSPQFSRYIASACRLQQEKVDLTAEWLKSLLLDRKKPKFI